MSEKLLQGKVALVAGATRGAGRGIAVELGAKGATVYVTGRTTLQHRSEYNRVETIEDTADLVTAAGGHGIAVPTDHLDPAQVETLVNRIREEQGQLDILVNDIWGGELFIEWNIPIWEHSLEKGLRMLHLAIDTHLITSHFALPLLIQKPGGLLIEMTDGTEEYNRTHYRLSVFYDLAKTAITRIAWAQGKELQPYGCTAVSLTPGWMRSEMMLEHYGVTEANWQEATAKEPHFIISETTHFVGRAVAALAADPDRSRWNGQSLSSGQLAQVYGFTDLDGSQPDCWRDWLSLMKALVGETRCRDQDNHLLAPEPHYVRSKDIVILTPFQRSDFDRLISWIGSKALLVTIAGTEWTYPLTAEQLEVYLNNPRSHSFNIVNEEQNATVGHAQILLYDDGTCKIDKLIIGDPSHRGKGLCQQVMKELVAFAFTRLPVHTVELNVFDWNSSAIRCYEKVGFKFNPAKKQTFEIDGQKWVALNMSIQKSN